jgi:hypothetical protein
MAIDIKKHVIITSSSIYKDMEGEIQDVFIDRNTIYINNDVFYQVLFITPPENFHNTSYFTESEFKIL